MVEELRRDLPNVKNRHDNEAAVLKQSMNPDLVLAGLEEPDESENLPKAIVAAAKIRSGKK